MTRGHGDFCVFLKHNVSLREGEERPSNKNNFVCNFYEITAQNRVLTAGKSVTNRIRQKLNHGDNPFLVSLLVRVSSGSDTKASSTSYTEFR